MASSAPYLQNRDLPLGAGAYSVPWSDLLQVQGKTLQVDGDGGATPVGECQLEISTDGVEYLAEGTPISSFPAMVEITKTCTHARVRTTTGLTHSPVARMAGVIY